VDGRHKAGHDGLLRSGAAMCRPWGVGAAVVPRVAPLRFGVRCFLIPSRPTTPAPPRHIPRTHRPPFSNGIFRPNSFAISCTAGNTSWPSSGGSLCLIGPNSAMTCAHV